MLRVLLLIDGWQQQIDQKQLPSFKYVLVLQYWMIWFDFNIFLLYISRPSILSTLIDRRSHSSHNIILFKNNPTKWK